MTEEQERRAVVTETRSWIGTPYNSGQDVKGAGVDCGMILVRVFDAVGLLPQGLDPRPYPAQWAIHQREEMYLGWLKKFGREIDEGAAGPGDVVAMLFGLVFGHAAIITSWPMVVHAIGNKVREDDFSRNALLRKLASDKENVKLRFFSIWPRKEGKEVS